MFLVAGLLLMGGCTKKPDITEDAIEKDLLKSGALHDSSIDLLKLEVLDQKQSQDALDVSAEIRYFTSQVKVDSNITMHYAWKDGAWIYVDADETPLMIFVKKNPTEDEITKEARELQYSKESEYLKYTSQDADMNYWYEEIDPQPTQGKISYLVHESVAGDTLVLRTEYTVEASYRLEEGWHFEVTDWKRIVSLELIQGWIGGYELTWDNAFSKKFNLASDPSKSVYRVDEPIKDLYYEGAIKLIEGKDKTPSIESDLVLTFNYKGKKYTETAKTVGLDPTLMILELDNDPKYTITFQLYAPGEGPDTSSTVSYFTILDPFNVSATMKMVYCVDCE